MSRSSLSRTGGRGKELEQGAVRQAFNGFFGGGHVDMIAAHLGKRGGKGVFVRFEDPELHKKGHLETTSLIPTMRRKKKTGDEKIQGHLSRLPAGCLLSFS